MLEYFCANLLKGVNTVFHNSRRYITSLCQCLQVNNSFDVHLGVGGRANKYCRMCMVGFIYAFYYYEKLY